MHIVSINNFFTKILLKKKNLSIIKKCSINQPYEKVNKRKKKKVVLIKEQI